MGLNVDELTDTPETDKPTAATTHEALGGGDTAPKNKGIVIHLSSGRICELDANISHEAMSKFVRSLFDDLHGATKQVEEKLSSDPSANVDEELCKVFIAERTLLSIRECFGATSAAVPSLTPVIEILEAQIALDTPDAEGEDKEFSADDFEDISEREAAFLHVLDILGDIERRRIPQAEDSDCCCGDSECKKEEEAKA